MIKYIFQMEKCSKKLRITRCVKNSYKLSKKQKPKIFQFRRNACRWKLLHLIINNVIHTWWLLLLQSLRIQQILSDIRVSEVSDISFLSNFINLPNLGWLSLSFPQIILQFSTFEYFNYDKGRTTFWQMMKSELHLNNWFKYWVFSDKEGNFLVTYIPGHWMM